MRWPRIRVAKRWRIVFAAVAAMLVVIFVWYPWANQGHILGIVREWGRLAPIPESATSLQVSTEGNMFTRAFRVSFSAPGQDIERWLGESPGTREAVPDHPSPTSRHYLIHPGGGAQHAEVDVDDASGVVRIYVYWS